jgi:hypothetical protein
VLPVGKQTGRNRHKKEVLNSVADTNLNRNNIKGFAKTIKLFAFLLSSFLMLMVLPIKSRADLIPNPDPASWADDIGGSGYFAHADQVFFEEFLDIGPDLGLQGSEFGFFFAGTDITDPINLIPIFDSSDIGSQNRLARVDFTTGNVYDRDQGNVIQNTFTGSGTIGFYFSLDPLSGVPTLFSDSSLNSDTDVVGTYPTLDPPANEFLIAFQYPDGTGGYDSLLFEGVSGIEPVPLPSTLLLFCSGLAGVAWYSQKKRRQNNPDQARTQ